MVTFESVCKTDWRLWSNSVVSEGEEWARNLAQGQLQGLCARVWDFQTPILQVYHNWISCLFGRMSDMFYNSRKRNCRICVFFFLTKGGGCQHKGDIIQPIRNRMGNMELIVSVLRNDLTEAECNLRKIRKDIPSPQKSRTLNSNFLRINSSDKYKNKLNCLNGGCVMSICFYKLWFCRSYWNIA